MAAAISAIRHAGIVQESVATDDLAENFTLPPEHLRVKEGIIDKKRVGSTITWMPRLAVLTQETLYFANPSTDLIIDEIPVHEINKVFLQEDEDESNDDYQEIIIETIPDGYNSGRAYIHRAFREDAGKWTETIERQAKYARHLQEEASRTERGPLAMCRLRVKQVYENSITQSLIAFLILASFAMDLAQAEILPEDGSSTQNFFDQMDVFFASIFCFELAVNLFSKSKDRCKEFLSDGWNMLDVVIVSLSLLTVLASGIPSLKVFRLIRVFRVARVFRKLKSLNRIITALASAVIPVANSFIILALVTCIWAALGTHFFSARSEAYFGTFSRSLFTMFQVVTGDSWASAVTRSIFDGPAMRTQFDYWTSFFFVSYVLIAGVFLINVVVAVLLDEFISSIQAEKAQIEAANREQDEKEKELRRSKSVLDPLSSHLSLFVNERDLMQRISETYERLDKDGSGGLNFEEFQRGLKQLPTSSPIHLLQDDFEFLTEGGRHCNSNGEFSKEQFQEIMKEELRRYALRKLSNAMAETSSKEFAALFLMMKMIAMQTEQHSDIINSWGYSTKGKNRILDIFHQVDKDENGVLDLEEAEEALNLLGIPPSLHQHVINRLDSDKDHCISKDEFMSVSMIVEDESDFRIRSIETDVKGLRQDLKTLTLALDKVLGGQLAPSVFSEPAGGQDQQIFQGRKVHLDRHETIQRGSEEIRSLHDRQKKTSAPSPSQIPTACVLQTELLKPEQAQDHEGFNEGASKKRDSAENLPTSSDGNRTGHAAVRRVSLSNIPRSMSLVTGSPLLTSSSSPFFLLFIFPPPPASRMSPGALQALPQAPEPTGLRRRGSEMSKLALGFLVVMSKIRFVARHAMWSVVDV
eukprot:190222-Hanusia_phi.AAC.8